MDLLAQSQSNVNQLFGTVAPPGPQGLEDPASGLASIITTGILLALFIGGLLLLAYLFWGALDWIRSGGEEEMLEKARGKITQAILGMLLLAVSLTIFVTIGSTVLGLFRFDGGEIQFTLPQIGATPTP